MTVQYNFRKENGETMTVQYNFRKENGETSYLV